MRPQKARQEEQRLLSHQLYKGQSMMSNVHDNLKRLLPGFPISENTEQIRIVHPNDVPAEYEVIIKKNGSSYYLFAKYRGSTTFFTSVLTSNEATVGAYFLADKHLKCNPKPLHKWIRKDILYYQKCLSKKLRCPLNLEAIENLYIEIWELR